MARTRKEVTTALDNHGKNRPDPVTLHDVLEQVEATRVQVDLLRDMLRRAEKDLGLSARLNEMSVRLDVLLGGTPAEKPRGPAAAAGEPAPGRTETAAPPARTPIPGPAKTRERPAYDAVALRTMAVKPHAWTDAKKQSAKANPNIHPDCIGDDGIICPMPYTWTAVSMVLHDGASVPVCVLSKNTGMSPAEIRSLLVRMDIDEKPDPKPEPAPPPVVPDPAPQTKERGFLDSEQKRAGPARPKPDYERCLPATARQYTRQALIRSLRAYAGLTPSELARASGVGNGDFIRKLESGAHVLSNAHIERLDQAFLRLLPDVVTNKKVVECGNIRQILYLGKTRTPSERLRVLRSRLGWLPAEAAAKARLRPETYLGLELRCTSRAVLDMLLRTWDVDTEILDDICEEPSGRPCDRRQTGLNVSAMLDARGLSREALKSALELDESSIQKLLDGRLPVTLRLVAELANLFECDTNAFYATVE